MEDDWKKLLHGGFAFMTAPFAVHPRDEERARQFYSVAREQGVTLDEILSEARRYLEERGCKQDYIDKELGRVKRFCSSL